MKRLILTSAISFIAVTASAQDNRLKAADGQPCYYFSTIEGTQKDEIYVHSSCLSQEGKDWIAGKMTAGAADLTQYAPTYYGFRTELRESVVQGYSDEDEVIFEQFKSSGLDPVATGLAMPLPPENGAYMIYRELQLPPENGAYRIYRELQLPPENGERLIMPGSSEGVMDGPYSKMGVGKKSACLKKRDAFF